jgi:hypothetical protein
LSQKYIINERGAPAKNRRFDFKAPVFDLDEDSKITLGQNIDII